MMKQDGKLRLTPGGVRRARAFLACVTVALFTMTVAPAFAAPAPTPAPAGEPLPMPSTGAPDAPDAPSPEPTLAPFALSAATLEAGVPVELTAPSLLLFSVDTGAVLFERNADERRQVASVTKLMTLLLLMEDIASGAISLDEKVTVSRNAAAMKGSQALLDADAQYPLEDLLRATAIASANDGAVALAEHVAGSEEAFVSRMNARAAELGMTNTVYRNCTGLPDDAQYTTARDVARLSGEMARHDGYRRYASIWLDTLTHPGGRVTDLTNTNRLVRFYAGCDGFKTGSTNEAKYCVSATAARGGMRLCAVVLGAQNSQKRFDDARAMLDYGFANYRLTEVVRKGARVPQAIPVRRGAVDQVEAAAGSGLSMLLRAGQEKKISLSFELPAEVDAPVEAGRKLGVIRVTLDGAPVAELDAVAASDVPMPGYIEGFWRILNAWR